MGLGIDEILINFLNYEYKIDFNNVQVINIHIYANLMPVFFLKCENRYFIMELDYIKNSISYIMIWMMIKFLSCKATKETI